MFIAFRSVPFIAPLGATCACYAKQDAPIGALYLPKPLELQTSCSSGAKDESTRYNGSPFDEKLVTPAAFFRDSTDSTSGVEGDENFQPALASSRKLRNSLFDPMHTSTEENRTSSMNTFPEHTYSFC